MPALRLRLAGGIDGYVVERDAIELRESPSVWMVADDERDPASKLATLVPVKQVEQAVLLAGDKDRHRSRRGGILHAPAHLELLGHRAETLGKLKRLHVETVQ